MISFNTYTFFFIVLAAIQSSEWIPVHVLTHSMRSKPCKLRMRIWEKPAAARRRLNSTLVRSEAPLKRHIMVMSEPKAMHVLAYEFLAGSTTFSWISSFPFSDNAWWQFLRILMHSSSLQLCNTCCSKSINDYYSVSGELLMTMSH